MLFGIVRDEFVVDVGERGGGEEGEEGDDVGGCAAEVEVSKARERCRQEWSRTLGSKAVEARLEVLERPRKALDEGPVRLEQQLRREPQ